MKYMLLFFTGIMMILVSSCSDSSSSNPQDKLSLSVKASIPVLSKINADTLTISSVQLVFKEIEFENEQVDSIEFETNQIVVDVKLDGSLTEVAVHDIPDGVYDKVELEFGGDDDDGDGVDSSRHSVKVTGMFNGEPFEFYSYVCYEIEQHFEPALVINDSLTSYNITLEVKPYDWFMDGQGNVVNPVDHRYKSMIDHNIKASFSMYEDHDHNGDDDHHDDDHGGHGNP